MVEFFFEGRFCLSWNVLCTVEGAIVVFCGAFSLQANSNFSCHGWLETMCAGDHMTKYYNFSDERGTSLEQSRRQTSGSPENGCVLNVLYSLSIVFRMLAPHSVSWGRGHKTSQTYLFASHTLWYILAYDLGFIWSYDHMIICSCFAVVASFIIWSCGHMFTWSYDHMII